MGPQKKGEPSVGRGQERGREGNKEKKNQRGGERGLRCAFTWLTGGSVKKGTLLK